MAFLPWTTFSIHKSSKKQEIWGKHVLMITRDLSYGIVVYAKRHPILFKFCFVLFFLLCCTSVCIRGRLFLKRKSHMAYNIKLLSSRPCGRAGAVGKRGSRFWLLFPRLHSRQSCRGNRHLQYPLLPAVLSPLLPLTPQPSPGSFPSGWREKGWQHWLAGLERMWQAAVSSGCGR